MATETKTARTLSDNEASKVTGALTVLLSVLGTAEFGEALPSDVSTLTEKQEEALVVRTILALRSKRQEASRAILVAAKKEVDRILHVARVARVEAYREIAALSPVVKAMLGEKANSPASTSVLVSDIMHAFPEGTTQEQAIALLHKMSYKLVAGAKRDDVKKVLVHIGSDFVTSYLSKPVETEETEETTEG